MCTLQADDYVELWMEVKKNMFMLLACAAYVICDMTCASLSCNSAQVPQ